MSNKFRLLETERREFKPVHKDLTLKLAILMALANADRASDLCALDVNHLSLTSEGATFQVVIPTKSARPDRQIISFYAPLEDKVLLSSNYLAAVPKMFSYKERWLRQESAFPFYHQATSPNYSSHYCTLAIGGRS